MFAGPNGSGKSTLKSYLPIELLGVYLNPDEVEEQIRLDGFLDLTAYRVQTSADKVLPFIRESRFLESAGRGDLAKRLGFENDRLDFAHVPVDSYFASVVIDFIRQTLLNSRVTFTFETVMSHPGKVDLLAQARQLGYRTYLYFVATEDPSINISRVRNRVQLGGHPVPEDKVQSRYYRSLDLLLSAIRLTDRAYIFDNSGEAQAWIAEITDGKRVALKSNTIPAWFNQAVLSKLAVGKTI